MAGGAGSSSNTLRGKSAGITRFLGRILSAASKRRGRAFAEGTRITCTGSERTELGRVRMIELLELLIEEVDIVDSDRSCLRRAPINGTDGVGEADGTGSSDRVEVK